MRSTYYPGVCTKPGTYCTKQVSQYCILLLRKAECDFTILPESLQNSMFG